MYVFDIDVTRNGNNLKLKVKSEFSLSMGLTLSRARAINESNAVGQAFIVWIIKMANITDILSPLGISIYSCSRMYSEWIVREALKAFVPRDLLTLTCE